MKPIKVLIVDDSPLIRKILTHVLELQPDLQVLGAAADAFAARDLIVANPPDVMTLDIEMPKMDGLTFLKKVMEHEPMPVLIVSSFAKSKSELAIKALEAGAFDVIEKPAMSASSALGELSQSLAEKIRTAYASRHKLRNKFQTRPSAHAHVRIRPTDHVLAVASSTGGTEALRVFLSGFPENPPATVVVQHMPAHFTKSFADSLNQRFPFEVREAQNGDLLSQGRVLLAPGNHHMEIRQTGSGLQVYLHDAPLMHGVRPAADYLFKSVAQAVGSRAMGVILTGMGKDGAQGLLEMKSKGAVTFVQSEKTCVVYGMPGAAVALGAVDHILDLEDLAPAFIQKLRKQAA